MTNEEIISNNPIVIKTLHRILKNPVSSWGPEISAVAIISSPKKNPSQQTFFKNPMTFNVRKFTKDGTWNAIEIPLERKIKETTKILKIKNSFIFK